MGHGMMPNVPIGVPPPAMQGLLMPPTGQMMHQQMIGGVPQPVNSPFSAGRKYWLTEVFIACDKVPTRRYHPTCFDSYLALIYIYKTYCTQEGFTDFQSLLSISYILNMCAGFSMDVSY